MTEVRCYEVPEAEVWRCGECHELVTAYELTIEDSEYPVPPIGAGRESYVADHLCHPCEHHGRPYWTRSGEPLEHSP